MEITLKMKIQDQDFDLKVDLTMKAGRIYRQQFNRDLVDDMTEIYTILNRSIYDSLDLFKIDVDGKSEDEIYQQIVDQAMPIYLAQRKTANLSYQHTEQASQIIWAFCKNADEKIPNYEEWIDSFDFILPIKDLIDALYTAWNESAKPTVEIKK